MDLDFKLYQKVNSKGSYIKMKGWGKALSRWNLSWTALPVKLKGTRPRIGTIYWAQLYNFCGKFDQDHRLTIISAGVKPWNENLFINFSREQLYPKSAKSARVNDCWDASAIKVAVPNLIVWFSFFPLTVHSGRNMIYYDISSSFRVIFGLWGFYNLGYACIMKGTVYFFVKVRAWLRLRHRITPAKLRRQYAAWFFNFGGEYIVFVWCRYISFLSCNAKS